MPRTKANGKSGVKEQVIELVKSLPDDCSVEDTQYHLYVREKVLRGIRAVEMGDFVSQDEIEKRSTRWLRFSGRSPRKRISER